MRSEPGRIYSYRLAKELGVPNVDAMLDDMGADQFVEWLAFDEIQRDAERKATEAARAEQGVRSHRRGSK